MTSLFPNSMSYEDSVSSCWNEPPTVRKYKQYSLMCAIYNESPLMTMLVQRAGLENMLENLRGTCFCPSFSYSVQHRDHFESISPLQARWLVLSACSPLLIREEDIRDCIRIPTCTGGYLSVEEKKEGCKQVFTIGKADIIKMEKNMVDMDNNVNGIVYVLNGLIDES